MLTFDTIKFAKDANAHHKRRVKDRAGHNQAASALEIGISPSSFSGVLLARMPSIETALSVCAWMKKDVSAYAKAGLPHGLTARWTATHDDGRQVVIEHTPQRASFTERSGQTGKVLNSGQANYGNGAHHFSELLDKYKNQGFTETEHLTA